MLGAVVLAGLAVVLFSGLRDATVFFLNVDEAVERQTEMGSDRFRMQGNPVGHTITETDDGVSFDLSFDGVSAPVDHFGDPPALFQDGIPVVLEGRWVGDRFESDEMLIRHDSEYEADNGERLDDARTDAGADADADADAGTEPGTDTDARTDAEADR